MKDQEEIFIWNGIHIRQRDDVFKIGTDALLLGAWAPGIVESAQKILDAGTGTGILALMVAQSFSDAYITAVDQNDAAVELSGSNFKNSIWAERIEARKENVLDPDVSEKNRYDLILINPPFFYRQLEAASHVKISAKHAQDSSMKWMNAMTDKLQSSGHMCMVVPYPSAFEWIASANAHGLYCHHRMDVYSFHDDLNPTRSLLHFQRKLKMPEKSRLDIYASLNQYTEAYLDFTKINQHPDRLKRNGLSQ